MNKPQVVQSEGQLSHYIKSENKFGQPVYVPVVDVRDGIAERQLAKQMISAQNRSRYMSYNHYHISPKKEIKPISI